MFVGRLPGDVRRDPRRHTPAALLEFLMDMAREFGVALPPRREEAPGVPWHPAGPGAQEPAPEPDLGRPGPLPDAPRPGRAPAAGRPAPTRWAPHLAGL
eukprot:13787579-Alexandrium_andersonii.AAC.1